MRVAVVIPALDEELAIGQVVRELPPVEAGVFVVDNGSRDRTAEVARAAGATVLHEPRRGYGQACLTGIAAAAAAGADVYAFVDGDLSDYPAQLADVLLPLRREEADLVIGSRQLGRRAKGAHPWHAVAGTRLCVAFMNAALGSRATDLGPFRAITRAGYERLEMADRAYGWTVEMQARAQKRGLRVAEVPVDYRPRLGRSKVSGTLSGSVRAGARILATIAREALSR